MNSKKKSKKKVIIFSVAMGALVVFALLVVLGSKDEEILAVQTEKVTTRTITQAVSATGKIYPEVQVLITPEVSGEITDLPVVEGMRVKKGDLLMRIKPDIYIAQRDRAEAGMKSAAASMKRAESEYNRSKDLHTKGLTSESELELAKMEYDVRAASYDQAKASLDQASEDLKKTTIYSPMDGTVSQLAVEQGERVLGTAQFQGTQVMTIADLSRMEARVDVGENDIVLISIGDTVRIEVDAMADKKLNGIVYEIGNTAQTRGLGTQEEVTNFQVKIRIVDAEKLLRPGMSMNATVETETRLGVLAVPLQSVTVRLPEMPMEGGGDEEGEDAPPVQTTGQQQAKKKQMKPKEVVFIVEESKAKTYEVTRGISDDGYTEIITGLKEGAEVVSGSYKAINRELKDGSTVRVDNQEGGPGAQGGGEKPDPQ